MESQSMRRRHTVLGEQLQAASNSSQFLNVPTVATTSDADSSVSNVADTHSNSTGANAASNISYHIPTRSVGQHMRSFSRISARGVQLGNNSSTSVAGNTSGVGNGSQLSVPSTSQNFHDDSLISDAASVVSQFNGDDDLDAALFSGPIDASAYLSRTLAGATPADLLRFGEKLRIQAQKAHEAEQRKLQHSHKALIAVAANVAKLAPAVAEIRKKVAELSLVSDAMHQDAVTFSMSSGIGPGSGANAGSGQHGGSRRSSSATVAHGDEDGGFDDSPLHPGSSSLPIDRRQSMLVLNPAWTNDLNDLYRRVDGVQRVLPPAPGRHLVHEEQNWSELNLVTQKPVRPVLIILLNDFILVASPKHGRFAHSYHMPLEETLNVNINEQNKVLRVSKGSIQIGLQAPTLSRLRVVYAEICKHVELATTRRRHNIRNSSMRLAGSSTATGNSSTGSGLKGTEVDKLHGIAPGGSNSRVGRSRSTYHARKASHSSLASVPEISVEQRREAARIIAEIDRCIAHRQWVQAAEQCLEHEQDTLVSSLVSERRAQLVEYMLEELNDRRMLLTRDDKCKVVLQLSRLDRAHEAKYALLATAASDIELQARGVHFMGDVVNYISQMAAIYFQTIISTIQVYQKAFPRKEDSSFAVTWVKTQVDLYAAIFNRQLFRIAPEFKAYQRCREVSRLESSQLRELNMDMEFMLRYVWES